MTEADALHFARDWISAWNAHDLGRILDHYSEDFEMSSPLIAKLTGDARGVLKGKDAVGEYWAGALARFPNLHFEFIRVYVGGRTVCLNYRSINRLLAVEWFCFDDAGKVCRASAHYDKLG